MSESETFDGGCTCGAVRYRLISRPLFVHCCRCTWCQRETGSAFVLNALIESDLVELLQGSPQLVMTPSQSGEGQKIFRCPECQIAVWSNYATAVKNRMRFVRAGTLDEPGRLPPDIHIFTASKPDWLELPPGIPSVEQYYDRKIFWPEDSLARYAKLKAPPGE